MHPSLNQEDAAPESPSTALVRERQSSLTQEDASPQTRHLREWVEAEKQKGLVDIKFFPKETDRSTVETFATEVNAMIEAPKVPNKRFF